MKRYLAHFFQLSTNRPITTVAVAIILTLSLFLPLGWSAWSAYQTFNRVIVNDFRLQYLVGSIIHLDEVLTMSARMNAATGDTRWEDRYSQFEPQLEAAIEEAIQIAPEAYEGEGATQTDLANQKLVAMEQQSFELVRSGQQLAASKLLFSAEYEQQKDIYAQGIQRGLEATQTRIQENRNNFAQQLILASAIAVLSLLMLLPIWRVVLQVLQRYLEARNIAEHALSAAKDQLAAVLDAVPGPVSWIDSGGVYIGVNRHFANSWSMSQGAFIGKTVNSLNGNTHLATFLQEFINSPQEADARTIEVKVKGIPRYYLVAVQKYQQGMAVVSVGIDITERKRAEEALRIAEENYRSIFENALEGIFQSSPQGYFINVNPTLARIYGYASPQEMIDSITDISSQLYVDADRRTEFIRAIEQQGTVKDFEYRCHCKDGTIIWTQIDARVVRDDSGNVLYYEGIVQDITERKQREEQLRRQLEELQIEIDHKQREAEVATLTSSNYFKEIQQEMTTINLDEFWR
ncbi:MAG: PAS domain S-box protein [Kaiparowitsia implicata GSE-PSE-MK54-09C]|jgi:PAS domain S-box-containing protein|nr:PAS domain S-box protein [Kaiparowitsia implicata GSE-PSE-MK54-09C]